MSNSNGITDNQARGTAAPLSQWGEQIRPVSGISSHDPIAEELAARERADAEGIARRKPFIDQYLR